MEQWKTVIIDGKETHFQISSYGRLLNLKTQHWKHKGIIKPRKHNKSGYYRYTLSIDNVQTDYYVHRLVAQAFIPNPDNKPEVNHKDGDKSNNKVSNLEWATPKENMQHAFKHELVSTAKPCMVYELDGTFVGRYESISEAARQLNVQYLDTQYGQSSGYQVFLEESEHDVKDITKTCKRQNIGVVQLTMDGKFVAYHKSLKEALLSLGVEKGGMISAVCKGKRKSYHGYKWVYAEEYYKN